MTKKTFLRSELQKVKQKSIRTINPVTSQDQTANPTKNQTSHSERHIPTSKNFNGAAKPNSLHNPKTKNSQRKPKILTPWKDQVSSSPTSTPCQKNEKSFSTKTLSATSTNAPRSPPIVTSISRTVYLIRLKRTRTNLILKHTSTPPNPAATKTFPRQSTRSSRSFHISSP